MHINLVNDHNNHQLLLALRDLRANDIPLDGKLSLILYLLEHDKHAGVGLLSPHRLSFHQYLGACYNEKAPDRTACVVGQDLFDLNLFDLNNLCSFLGLPTYQDVYDFNLETFVRSLRGIASGSLQTRTERLAAQYLANCQRRAVNDGVIKDNTYKQPFYICGIDDCRKYFLRQYDFLNHKQAKHDLIPFVCPFEGCDRQLDFPSGLMAHKRLEHGSEPALYCPHCQKPFENQQALDAHFNGSQNSASSQYIFNNNAIICSLLNKLNPFVCQEDTYGCRYALLKTLEAHIDLQNRPQE